MVGECGGKNFHFIHPSADVESAVNSTFLAAFEYSGQKCSACSRIYVPQSLWTKVTQHDLIKISFCNYSNFYLTTSYYVPVLFNSSKKHLRLD